MWGPDVPPGEDPSLECCRPLKVEVYRLEDKSSVLASWKSPEFAGNAYHGAHGLIAKQWGA